MRFALVIASALALSACSHVYKPIPYGTKTIEIEYTPLVPDVSVSAYALSPCIPSPVVMPPGRPPTVHDAMREVRRSRASLRNCMARHARLIEETKAALGAIRHADD